MTEDMFSLAGRTALVTGSTRGIGRMIAVGLARQGAKVYVSGRSQVACDDVAATLSRDGVTCVGLAGDVATMDGVNSLAANYLERESTLDILINNAGADSIEAFGDVTEHGWDHVMDINLKSPFFLIQALHGALVAAASRERPAKVINVASVDAFRLNAVEAYSYHASKAGLVWTTQRVAARLIEDSINVTAIAPGAFATDMNVPASEHEEFYSARIPSRRIGRDDDMAGAAIFLASRAGDYVVGETIIVDGGLTLAAVGRTSEPVELPN